MKILEDLEFFIFELSYSISSLSTTQWGFIVFSILVFGSMILVIAPKSKGMIELFRGTLRHDKKPVIGLFVVLPIFVIGYIWAFSWIF